MERTNIFTVERLARFFFLKREIKHVCVSHKQTVMVFLCLLISAFASAQTLKGDVNGDGKVDQSDVTALADAYVKDVGVASVLDIDGDNALTIADVTALINISNRGGASGSANGHDYVDLGLPSGALWATCNVGASTPQEPGALFAWGETETKEVYSWATYKWCDGDAVNKTNQNLTKYCDRGAFGRLDGKISLEPEDDVAHVKWGGDWHMPTREEFQELMDNCTFEYDWINEEKTIEGYKITGRNGNSIIMPAAGYRKDDTYKSNKFYYWSATLFMRDIPSNNQGAHVTCLEYQDDNEAELLGSYRYRGYAVRPVLSKYTPVTHTIYGAPSSYMNHNLVDLGLPTATLWATCNIGAYSPEDNGCYYSWGEITGSCDGKTVFDVDNYPVDKTDQVEQGENLSLSDDAASVNWGGEWRMPTLNELRELMESRYTVWEWKTINGVNGYLITSVVKGFEGNSIFLPAAGYYDYRNVRYEGEKGNYWSSTLYGGHNVGNNVGYIYFNSEKISWWEYHPYYGLPIRPVVSFDKINN